MISSKISSAPDRSARSRRKGRNDRLRRADAAGALDRLDDDRGQIPFSAAQGRRDGVRIAPRQLDDELGHRVGHPGRADHHPVVRAVVGALELRDERSAGERARRPDREHRRLRAGAGEPQALDRRDAAPDLLGQLDLGLGRGREGRPAADLCLDRGDDRRVGVTEDERRVVAQKVAVAVAVDVLDPQPGTRRDVGWIGRRKDGRPGRATGQRGGRPLEQRPRTWRSRNIIVEQRHREGPPENRDPRFRGYADPFRGSTIGDAKATESSVVRNVARRTLGLLSRLTRERRDRVGYREEFSFSCTTTKI